MPIKEVLVDSKHLMIPFPASTAVGVGYLLYNNAGVAAKASAQTDQLTQAANQALFAKNFLGVAADQRLATETSTGDSSRRTVVAEGVFDLPCASTTWAVGDLIGAVEASSGTALEDEVVAKVTDPALAIGVCVKAATSSTTVRGKLTSRFAPPQVARDVTYVSYYFTGTPAATDQVFFVAPHACRVVAISQVHSVAAGGASTLQVVKDSSTNAPGAGTDLLSAAFDLNATANTVQQGALSATAADLILAPGDRLAVDFANTIQSTAGVCVTVALAPVTAG